MARMLILYSTTDGHTREICERLQSVVEGQGHQVTLASVTAHPVPDLQDFQRIIIGASIRYGKHSPQLIEFINRNAGILNARPSAFFSVSVAARKPKNSRPETNAYMQAFLRKVSWRPAQLAVFAGKIDYPRYGFFDRLMIRLIMLVTGGPTDPQAVVDFTDWNQVEAFGRTIGGTEG
ncbi:MAG: menaquinone-dependent protoporphyrinogen IX dehydrogenase [Proteobacteria bacterium]|nr:menaquinone-dependent protoporphyrinogen IX dehydrogenase [Pseudomonadota bacterium]